MDNVKRSSADERAESDAMQSVLGGPKEPPLQRVPSFHDGLLNDHDTELWNRTGCALRMPIEHPSGAVNDMPQLLGMEQAATSMHIEPASLHIFDTESLELDGDMSNLKLSPDLESAQYAPRMPKESPFQHGYNMDNTQLAPKHHQLRGTEQARMRMPKKPAIPRVEASNRSRQTRVCVFCPTIKDFDDAQLAKAQSLARILHENHIELVYGAGITGAKGLMGELAKRVVGSSGRDHVHGIISSDTLKLDKRADAVNQPRQSYGGESAPTKSWFRKLPFRGHKQYRQSGGKSVSKPVAPIPEMVYGRTTVVPDLQARKKLMCRIISEGGPGSGFVALGGGFDIMNEVMEMVTWRQYGVHTMRICLLNVEGFWDPLLTWMELAIEKKFIVEEARNILAVTETAEEAIEWLKSG